MPRAKSNGGVGLGKPIAFHLSEADRGVYLEKVAASGLTQSEFFCQVVLTTQAGDCAPEGERGPEASAVRVQQDQQ
jgi:hypothetical protein